MMTAASTDQRAYLSLGKGEEEQEESLELPVEWEPVKFMM